MALLLLLLWWTFTLGTRATTWCFLDLPNLAFHEAGHIFFRFGGSTVQFLGGTLGQLLVPGLLVFYFLLKQRQPLGAAFCAWWFGENFINISIYMADARSLALPLVGGGDHDWNELFYRFGLLTEASVQRTAALTHLCGVVFMTAGLFWCTYFVLPADARARIQHGLLSRWPWLEPALEV